MKKKSTTVLVESFDDYEIFKNNSKINNNILWLVPNQYLFHKLQEIGETVLNFENNIVSQKDYDDLCINVHNLLKSFNENINDEILFINKFYFESIRRSLATFFLTTCYKYLIIKKIIDKYITDNDELYVVGNTDYFKKVNLPIDYGRFDTIYIYFAKLFNNENLNFYETKKIEKLSNQENGKLIYNETIIEKILKLSFNSFNSFSFKLHRKIISTKFLKPIFDKINIFNFQKKIIVWGKHNRNEIIYDSFFKIIFKGGYIRYNDGINLILEKNISNLKDDLKLSNSLNFYFNNKIKNSSLINFFNHKDLVHLANIITERIYYSHQLLKSENNNLQKIFRDKFNYLNKYDFVFTNGFFRAEEKLFYNFCISNNKKKFRFVAFEHGLTYGLTSRDKFYLDSYSMKYSDIGVYTSNYSFNSVEHLYPNQIKFISGIPNTYRKSFINFIPKFLLCINLRLNFFKKKIFLLAACENNNYTYGPFYPRDFQKEQSLKDILNDLFTDFPDYEIVLKLYPGQRYIDKNNFFYLQKYFKKLKIVGDIELKLITKIIDIAALFYYTSTIGVINSSKAKLILYNFDFDDKIFLKNIKIIKKIDNFQKIIFDNEDLNYKWNSSFIDYLFDK